MEKETSVVAKRRRCLSTVGRSPRSITISHFFAAFIKALEFRGWDADTQLDHPSLTFLPLEDSNTTLEERENTIAQELKESTASKRVLIIKVSHVSAHKYVGNVIVSPCQKFPDSPHLSLSMFSTDLHSIWVWNLVWPSHTARRGFHRFQHNHQW